MGEVKGKRILITGGAGFIGTHLATALLPDNEIVILDNLRRDALQYTLLTANPRVRFLKGDVRDEQIVTEAVRGCHIILHLASIAGVDATLANPVETMEVCINGTQNLLRAAQHTGVQRFVDFSTSEVFGQYAYKVSEGDITALGAVGEARWTYAVSKLAMEHLAHNYHTSYGLPAVSIRPFNVYGPRQVGVGAIRQFIICAINNEPLVIHNDGSQIRSWCYIDDVVKGVVLTLQRDEALGQVFNIGNPRSTITIYGLAELVRRIAESESQIVFEQRDQQDVDLRIPDITKAKTILGFEPTIDLHEGIKRTLDYFRTLR